MWLRRGSLNIDNIVKYLEGRYICHIGTFSAFVEVVVDGRYWQNNNYCDDCHLYTIVTRISGCVD